MLHINLRQLEIFTAVAQQGSTVAAAEALGLSQSAISSGLRQLEHLLDTPLFDRSGRQLVLNEAGRFFRSRALAVLEQTQELQESFAEWKQLPVRIKLAASTTIGNHILPSLLARFTANHPHVQLQLMVGNTQQVTEQLQNWQADFGLIEGHNHAPELTANYWMADELVLVAASYHPLAVKQSPVTTQELSQARWLLREAGSGTREMVEHALLPQLHQLNTVATLSSSVAIAECVAQGMGISCLPRSQVQAQLQSGLLTELPSALPRLQRNLYFVQRNNQQLSPILQSLVDHCLASAQQA